MRSLSFLAAGRLTSDPADGESYSTSFGSPFGSRPERIERHSCDASGQASVWEMNGNSLIGGGPVSANPGAHSQAVA
jgi:hypothetical protein